MSKNNNLKLLSLTDLKSGEIINGVKVQKNSLEVFKKTDVIIDFSSPKASIEILNYAKKLKKKVVVGTTGFTQKQENIVKNFECLLRMLIFLLCEYITYSITIYDVIIKIHRRVLKYRSHIYVDFIILTIFYNIFFYHF
jgi:dihydrodipicolinate reductase